MPSNILHRQQGNKEKEVTNEGNMVLLQSEFHNL